jgi:phosphatidylserine/phosphatidylglycerophosphate/cardiolipin synthase-like enzyme
MIPTCTRTAARGTAVHSFNSRSFTPAAGTGNAGCSWRARCRALALAAAVLLAVPGGAAAQERLCDTQFEDCREALLNLIRNERIGIDVAFWFMEDYRYVAELIRKHDAGVPVRILVDPRANASKRLNEAMLKYLSDAGIPMREKFAGDVLHFKMMLFHGQNVVEFSKANYGSSSLAPDQANVNYFDEAVFFTSAGCRCGSSPNPPSTGMPDG